MVSFRLGGSDGVSIEAAKWAGAFGTLGWDVRTIAGDGPVDVLLPGLAMEAEEPPTRGELGDALSGADIVVVENLCSLPLNPRAGDVVASACAGRPAILHHHDLPWQRPHLAHLPPPPRDPLWAHVTINERSRAELARHGITATTIYNSFDPDPPPGDRDRTRRSLGIASEVRLLLQPTRALARKNVAAALELSQAVGGHFWLLGPAEDGYGPELDRLVARAGCPVLLGADHPAVRIADAYAACDAVLLPSTWEGFGNPSVESATHMRPLVVGPYPVANELAAFGFRWFGLDDIGPLARCLAEPDLELLRHNRAVARRHFNLADLPDVLGRVVDDVVSGRPEGVVTGR